jgi:hypothetical protein
MQHCKTRVVDAPMAAGKTTKLIKWIKEVHSYHPVIVLVERNSEVDRLKEALGDLVVSIKDEAENRGSRKIDVLNEHVADGNTVVSTHALMEYWDEGFLENVQFHKYELVIDESLSHVLEPIKIASRDIKIFLEDKRLIVQKENKYSRLTVSKEDSEGWCLPEGYKNLERKILNKCVYLQETEKENANGVKEYSLIEAMNPEIWSYFNQVLLMTYLFKGSLMEYYFQLHNIKYIPMGLSPDGRFVNHEIINGERYRPLITILDSYNNWDRYKDRKRTYRDGLSVNWCEHEAKGKNRLKMIQKKLRNTFEYLQRTQGITKEDFAFTFHKKFLKDIRCSHVGVLRDINKFWDDKNRHNITEKDIRNITFLPQTLRGTNMWSHKKVMCYLSNTHLHGSISSFLQGKGVDIDNDVFALSQMIQWIFRGCIRNGEPMTVWIPCQRMRHLFLKWLGYSEAELF